jgi:DNA polymerase (family X)
VGRNAEIAAALAEYAALLELAGASSYSARAFRRAAELVATTPVDVAQLVRGDRVRDLRGIGPGIERRLRELVETGRIAELDELRRTVSPELAAFGRLHGFSAKRFIEIGAALGIQTVTELRSAAAAGRLREVPGIGQRREEAIRAALAAPRPLQRQPLRLNRAWELLTRIAETLGGEVAGDPRRWRDESTRLAVVVPSTEPERTRERFAALPEIVALIDEDCGLAVDGTPVELVVAPPEAFGTALVRATGSPAYVAELEPLPAAADERDVYRALGLPFVPPELRELPLRPVPDALLDGSAIRGDLHCHTTWSDGRATVREMAEAARALGYAYLAICDHTTNVRVVPGLDADAVERQAVEIAAVNAELAPFRVLRGIECDILPDGSLDLPDDVLAELDWVQISLHAGQRAPRRELTARVVEAMHHPAARCLSHPTGRIIGHRPENALDLERTIEAALATGVALEVNGLPDRLDLRGELVAAAVDAGVRIVCSSDSHSTRGLANMTYAVHTARRGGAPAASVVNTSSVAVVLDRLSDLRSGEPSV